MDVCSQQKTVDVIENLLRIRPTLRPLACAQTLGKYLDPVLTWKFQPNLFPNAQLFLDLVQQEVGQCYGAEVALQVATQLKSNFTVETGVHVSLPRLHDKATVHSIPLNNVNTLTFQATLYSAAARLAAGQPFHISCSTGHISLSNINSGAYFQPDVEYCLRLQSNKHDKTPQTYLPPLTKEGLDKILHGKGLSSDGQMRAEAFRQNVLNHPDSFSRQIVTTHAALYNQVLPDSVHQITFDFELIMPAYLARLLQDQSSLTYNLFATLEGRDFLRNEFHDVITAWKADVPPFDVLEVRNGYPCLVHFPYAGSLSPENLCEALKQKHIIPKTALSFILFMLEAGLVPVGGMRQTHYATQIRDKLVKWLRCYHPHDPRVEVLAALPTDRASAVRRVRAVTAGLWLPPPPQPGSSIPLLLKGLSGRGVRPREKEQRNDRQNGHGNQSDQGCAALLCRRADGTGVDASVPRPQRQRHRPDHRGLRRRFSGIHAQASCRA